MCGRLALHAPGSTTVFTIGHSTHPLDVFLDLLDQHSIEVLADIRRYPSSRKFPHFNRAALEAALQEHGIEYHWFESLGGRRHSAKSDRASPNEGLRNAGFRSYADHMLTDEFRQAVLELLEIAQRRRAAIMCAEGMFWRCHRRLVSDSLVGNSITVEHILPTGQAKPHALTKGAEVRDGDVTYPKQRTLFEQSARPDER